MTAHTAKFGSCRNLLVEFCKHNLVVYLISFSQKFEDTDLQLSTSTLATRWYGFDDGLSGVTYKVCVGSSPGQQDIAAYEDAGGSLSHRFTNLTLNINQVHIKL